MIKSKLLNIEIIEKGNIKNFIKIIEHLNTRCLQSYLF